MKTFRELAENQLNQSIDDLDEFSAEEIWLEAKEKAKVQKSKVKSPYTIYKSKDYYFLIEDGNYIAHIDCTADKIEVGYSIFISTSFSNIRGGYLILINGLLSIPKIKNIISDQILSTPATKFWMKVMKDKSMKKRFFNYKDEVQLEFTDFNKEAQELFKNEEYRVGLYT